MAWMVSADQSLIVNLPSYLATNLWITVKLRPQQVSYRYPGILVGTAFIVLG